MSDEPHVKTVYSTKPGHRVLRRESCDCPIPEGHTDQSATVMRMASEWVVNRLIQSYGLDIPVEGETT